MYFTYVSNVHSEILNNFKGLQIEKYLCSYLKNVYAEQLESNIRFPKH
jgi:hypothetical protein